MIRKPFVVHFDHSISTQILNRFRRMRKDPIKSRLMFSLGRVGEKTQAMLQTPPLQIRPHQAVLRRL